MARPYPYADRDRVYAFLKQAEEFATLVEKIAEGQADHSPELQGALAALTGATDLHQQHKAVQYMLDRARKEHERRLIEAAPNDFTAYVEVINPEEPCASKLHRFLGETLMEMEANSGLKKGVSMPPGHAKDMCVSTPVMLADGSMKPLGEVQVGDFVITHTGSAREVLEVHDQGKRPVMRMRTLCGRELFPHPEHPFLTPAGWVQAQYLKQGDVLAQQREFSIPNGSGRSLYDFILAGYMMAAGMVRGRHYSRVFTVDRTFRTDDPEIMADLIDTAKRLGFRARIAKKGSYGKEIETARFDEKFIHWLRGQRLNGLHRHTMRVPDWVFKGGLIEIAAFVGAIFSMDASLVPTSHKQSLNARKMVIRLRNAGLVGDMQRLLARLGARSALDKHLVNNYNYEPTEFWSLTVWDAEDQYYLQRSMRVRGVNQRLWADPIVPRAFFDGRYATDRIIAIDYDWDVRETKCLTVDEDHSFLADGVVVHNSTYCSRLFPSWWMGKRENKRWLQAGHTQRFAEKEFGKKTRDNILATAAYQKVFPGVGVSTASQDEIILTNGCAYNVKGVGQGISGYRSHFNNVDDPYATHEDAMSPTIREKVWNWWANDFRTRRLPGAGELIIVTRWHTDDVVGRLEEMIKKGEIEPWEFINLPAFAVEENDVLNRKIGDVLWPEVFKKEFLLDIKGTSTEENWSALYQCAPVLEKGNILQRNWIKYYKQLPQRSIRPAGTVQAVNRAPVADPRLVRVDPLKFKIGAEGPSESKPGPADSGNQNSVFAIRTVVSVDTAETDSARADRSALQVWIYGSDRNHYLAHASVGKYLFPDLVEAIETTALAWGADLVLIETKGAGLQYIQARTGHSQTPIIGFNPKNIEKSMRFDGTMVMWQTGTVLLPEKGTWLADYVDELLKFPSGRYDDQVDATSQYLHWHRIDGGWDRGMKKIKG
ncbi:phage terminase large subunit [Pseudaminobacter sp. 19-2017]|uniref:Phage terminase large subunit n=1 Tax=Pseudaminobacter soli (ex Zhang et al. 2022) TaxID=2831468 RepID=A0A942E0K9_9HYPH|nr:phage terminase large subunit [Pseudaminobacter soli]MBS3648806.1 phage terminase large subunit [Pseudaminobacter soli]